MAQLIVGVSPKVEYTEIHTIKEVTKEMNNIHRSLLVATQFYCRKKAEAFALLYSGDWYWRLEVGNHCHTFQLALMNHLAFDKFKVIE